jgi:hypothetical protein
MAKAQLTATLDRHRQGARGRQGPAVQEEVTAWCPRQESNLHLSLRRAPFYPLNYKD